MTALDSFLAERKRIEDAATAKPWRWEEDYGFGIHTEHQKQGLEADCENIGAGRIQLMSENETVLREWASYADDSGLDIKKQDAALIVDARNSQETLIRMVEVMRDALNEVSRKRAATIFIEEPEHVTHYLKPVDDALEAVDRLARGEE